MKAQHPITIFEAITKQRVAGVWNISLALTQRAQTLDYYYRIYQALLEFEPERKRGYRERICYNLQICSELWGGGYLKYGTYLDIDTLKHAIAEMERLVWI